MEQDSAIKIIKSGGVAVIPTDTIYGLVADAKNQKAIQKIYNLKKRNPDKKLIVLINKISDLEQFDISISSELEKRISKYWPGPNSLILPTKNGGSLAFRLPKSSELQKILSETGPLVAPSANIEGQKPAETIEEAREYFGKNVDFYLDQGKISGKASCLIDLTGPKDNVLRN